MVKKPWWPQSSKYHTAPGVPRAKGAKGKMWRSSRRKKEGTWQKDDFHGEAAYACESIEGSTNPFFVKHVYTEYPMST